MALDFLAFKRIVELLRNDLLNGKIERIFQISNEEFLFEIRNNNKNYHMMISTHPLMPYINLMNSKPKTISIHTNLVLVLRKYLENGKIVKIKQQNDDRIVLFEILGKDDYYQNTTKKLYIELIGRASNLILTNQEDLIIDCFKKIPIQYNNLRTLLPNVKYNLPDKPINQKLPISIENELQFRHITCEELTELIDNSEQIYVSENETKKDFHFFPFLNLQGKFQAYPWNEGIEKFYYNVLNQERQRQNISSIEKNVKLEIKKNSKKLDKLHQDLQKAYQSSDYKYYGDLLLTYAQDVQSVKNPMMIKDEENNQEVLIPMDEHLSVFKNAALYYKKYQKSKVAIEKVNEQIELTKNQLDYLKSIHFHLMHASLFAIKEIEEELMQQGILRKKQKINPKNNKNKKKVEKVYKPLQYKLDEVIISVGENNLQNEYLTFKIAHKNHYYFHVQQFHGAHVIVHSDILNESLIRHAANLAALHSEACESSSVAVDYTQVKNVKKIPGGKPGKVLINRQKTIFIDPSNDLTLNLKKLS